MRIISAYLLAVLGGNKDPDVKAVHKILVRCAPGAPHSRELELAVVQGSVGIEAKEEEVEKV